MQIEKINWKIFATPDTPPLPTDTLFRIFNDWIPNSEEIFIDVTDYNHCYGGVKVFLAGNYVHYYWDETDGLLGLVYSRVKPFAMESEFEGKIRNSFFSFLKRLENFRKDPRLENQVSFDAKNLQFSVNDRALAPNNSDTFDRIAPIIKSELTAFSGGEVKLKHLSDPRRLFSINILLEKALFF